MSHVPARLVKPHQMAYIHFVCKKYDSDLELQFPDICKEIFSGDYLCVKEYKPSEHYHFQGMSTLSPAQLAEIQQTKITHHHRYRKEFPNCRLVKNSRKDITDKGFQYMCKYENSKVLATTFTEDQIKALRVASDLHVEQLKNGLREHLWDKYGRRIRENGRVQDYAELKVGLKALVQEMIGETCSWSYTNKKDIRQSQLKDRALNAILHYERTTDRQRRTLGTI